MSQTPFPISRKLLSEFAYDRIVLISTHIVSDVEYIATKNAIMKKGKLLSTGTTDELVQQLNGKVWSTTIPINRLPEYERELQIANIRNEEHGTVSIRYLADKPFTKDSSALEPHLEDLYLWLFPHESKERR